MGRCPQHLPFAKVPLPVCHETSSSVTKQSFLKTLFTPEEFENAGFVAGRTVDISGNDSLHTKKDNSLRCFLVSFIIQWGPPDGEFPGDFPQGPSPGTFQFPIKSGDNTAVFVLGQPLHELSRLRVAWSYRALLALVFLGYVFSCNVGIPIHFVVVDLWTPSNGSDRIRL